MSTITIINIILVNIGAWLLFSYFWGGWTFKIFKPYKWLDFNNKKLINKKILLLERRSKDKIRTHTFWLFINQLDERMVKGDIMFCGVEETDYITLASYTSPERNILIVDRLEEKNIHVIKENCQGTVTEQDIHLNNITEEQINRLSISKGKIEVYKGEIESQLDKIECNSLALAWIDCVESKDIENSLNFAYSKLSPGGIIIIHDYNHNWESVEIQVNRFINTIPETYIPIADMYGSIAIIKNSN
ncbi:MAG: hypothetical protein HUJ96_05080 [Marinilabiliaceae bacterium]|nr:hypothetical protein [Marinilabiliaceae bacterium]